MTEQLEELQLAVSTDKVRVVYRRNAQPREVSTAPIQATGCFGSRVASPMFEPTEARLDYVPPQRGFSFLFFISFFRRNTKQEEGNVLVPGWSLRPAPGLVCLS